ncbi:hypothetical protein BVI2075_230007 [Burkholderia vietnamiensis]|nr:hypothetical protein BVI2075_230007 [Burkholderia vietnamiensis]
MEGLFRDSLRGDDFGTLTPD